MNVHQVAPRQPILLATFTIDVGMDALAEAEIYELLSKPLVSTELAAALARCCVEVFIARLFESKRFPERGALPPSLGEELGWVLTSERPHPAHFARPSL